MTALDTVYSGNHNGMEASDCFGKTKNDKRGRHFKHLGNILSCNLRWHIHVVSESFLSLKWFSLIYLTAVVMAWLWV